MASEASRGQSFLDSSSIPGVKCSSVGLRQHNTDLILNPRWSYLRVLNFIKFTKTLSPIRITASGSDGGGVNISFGGAATPTALYKQPVNKTTYTKTVQ